MSEQGDSPRATVALVHEQLKSTNVLLEKGFSDMQRQLDDQKRALSNIPERLTRTEERVEAMSQRLNAVDGNASGLADLRATVQQHEERWEDQDKRREYRMGPLVPNLIGFAGIIVAAVTLVVTHA